jgi:lipopolysaccharide transport system permease protein
VTIAPPLATRIYTPESPLAHPAKLWREMKQDLWAGCGLAWRLAVRDISSLYRQSVLGVLWALINPLTSTAVWLFLSTSRLVQVAETEIPYPVFVFTGTLLWSILIDSFNAPPRAGERQPGTAGQDQLPPGSPDPHWHLPNAVQRRHQDRHPAAGAALSGYPPRLGGLLIPVGVLSLVLTGTPLGLAITPLGVLYGDIGRGIPLITQFLINLSPVVFPLGATGWTGTLMRLNPLTPLILNARAWFTAQPPQLLGEWALTVGGSAVLLLLVWMVYRLAMPILIERISA